MWNNYKKGEKENGKGKPQLIQCIYWCLLWCVGGGDHSIRDVHDKHVLSFSTFNTSFLKAPWAGLCQASAPAETGPESPPVSWEMKKYIVSLAAVSKNPVAFPAHFLLQKEKAPTVWLL